MHSKQPLLPIFLLCLLATIWGSSFILMKRGLLVFTPTELGAFRLAIAGLTLLPVVIKTIFTTDPKYFKFFAVVGIIGNGLPAFMFAIAQTKLNSATAGALNALTPLFTLLVANLFFKIVIKRNQVFGVVIGLIGAIGLIVVRSGGGFDPNWQYGLIVVLACVFYAISVNTVKAKLQFVNPFRVAAYPLVMVGLPAAVLLFVKTDFIFKMQNVDGAWSALAYISILGIIGSAASLVVFNKLIQLTNAIFASSVTYLMPLVALIWGVIDNETIGWSHALGMASILLGIYLVNKKPKQQIAQ